VPVDDERALAELCAACTISFERTDGACRVLLNGEDVSGEIRTPEISLLTSKVSARKGVRDCMLAQQRRMGQWGGVILEGRDIGTVVFPDAEVKFFLSASAEERGRRRFLELQAGGDAQSLEQTIADVIQRDRQDEEREHAPLCRAVDAIDIDSTGMSIQEVLDRMVDAVNEKVKETG
jgi:cytidylate kinase